ncbi:hypothetical protein HKX48_002239 [Thoreauomyces humboldtii]|nr:hypothetical protein HKX48_002239 [Thoreauomyces humboldtii]
MERSVNKLTSKTIKPLKPKHVQILTGASWQREIPISELFRFLNHRLREDHWVVVFKALITIHILMREGATDRVIGFVASNAGLLNMANFRDRTGTHLGHEQSKNLRAYSLYLEEKVMTYREIKTDFVRTKPDMIARLRTLSVKDGLLKEVELLQRQINALLSCTFYLEEIDNVVTLQAFRLLIGDMMALFHLLNESVIRILGEYFEMTKTDATRALQIYKNFATQTTKTVEFFEIARRLKHALGLDVPVFKHAPVSLAGALEDYLKAPDFETQRLAYKSKKAAKSGAAVEPSTSSGGTSSGTKKSDPKTKAQPEPVIDFFSSLDNELSALNAPAVQAQYNNSDPFGAMWAPEGSGNPFGSDDAGHASNPFAARTQELEKQTRDINSQLALLQMNPAGNNQMVLSGSNFGQLQPQASSTFGNNSFPPFGAQAPQAAGSGDNNFTVENVFGNGGASFGGPPTNHAAPAMGGGFAPAPPAPPTLSTGYDPFAGLGVVQSGSSQNPTLDPFQSNTNRPAPLQHQTSQHNPFASPATPFGGMQQSGFRPTPTSSPFGMGQQQSNYVATSNPGGPFGFPAASGLGGNSNGMQQPQLATGMPPNSLGMSMGNGSQLAFNPFAPAPQQSPPQQIQQQQGGFGGQPNAGAAAYNPFASLGGSSKGSGGFGAYQGAPGQQMQDSSLI